MTVNNVRDSSVAPDLQTYLARIEYHGPAEPTIDVLRDVHRAHAFTVPYENIDVYAQSRRLDVGVGAAFDKIVGAGRGGWCYEMNGVLGWALEEIGFDVTRMVGAVARQFLGDGMWGNHLVLLVHCDGPWLADVGLGDGLHEPIPLVEGVVSQGERTFRLERLVEDSDGGAPVWRFHNTEGVIPPSFDFREPDASRTGSPVGDASDVEEALASACATQQDDVAGTFRQNFIVQQMGPDETAKLIGRVLTADGRERLLASADELDDELRSRFGLSVAAAAEEIWPAIVARHREVFGSDDGLPGVFPPAG